MAYVIGIDCGTGSTKTVLFDENGNVIGPDGKIVGYVDKDGNVIGANGEIIGKIGDGRRLALDKNGKVIGYIEPDGTVKDFKGNILGKVDKDGNIVDKDGNIIGKAGAERRLALDKDGKVIGYVDENGRVIDEHGNVLGMVDKDGNIIGVNGDIIGSVGEAKNLAYDKDGNIIGYVGENGEVRDFAGNTLGYVDDNGNILNNTGEIIGSVGKNGKLAYDKDGNVIGYVDENGNVIGKVTSSGNIVVDENGNVLGVVMPDNSVVDKDGNIVGYVDENVNVVDAHVNVIGHVDGAGNVVDENGKFSGAIDLKDLIIARQSDTLDSIIIYSYPYFYADEKISDSIEKIKDYAEDSLPVLNHDKEIVGIITAQDVVEAVDDEMGEDYAKLAGLTAEEDLQETTKQSIKKRLPWLVVLLVLGMGVSAVVGAFENVVAILPIVICFQSLILDMAGNVGTQSLAVTIRVLMDEELAPKDKLKLVFKKDMILGTHF